MSSSGSKIRSTRPRDSASWPCTIRPEKSRSSARDWPTTRWNDHASARSAMIPRRLKTVVSFARDDAKRRSQFMAATRPMPAHAPLIAAMTGFRVLGGGGGGGGRGGGGGMGGGLGGGDSGGGCL